VKRARRWVRNRRELYWVVGFDVEFDLFAREGAHSVR
jgi:hypothetical protein